MGQRTKRRFAPGAGLLALLAFFTPIFLALAASPAVACQCIVQTSIQHLANADVVFTGRLTEIQDPPPLRLTYSNMDPVDYQFHVDRVLKGAVPVKATVRSVVPGGSCGLERMIIGDRYTVFAIARDGSLGASVCEGTHVGGPDPALAVVSGVLLAPTPNAPPWWVLILLAIAVVIGAAVGRRTWQVLRVRGTAR